MRIPRACLLAIATVSVGAGAAYPAAAAQERRPDLSAVAEWKAMLPAIKSELTRSGYVCQSGEAWEPHIFDASVTPRLSYALVDACNSGAYTDELVVMRMEHGQPVRARFRKDGKITSVEFVQGASVMHSVDVQLKPEQAAIFSSFFNLDGAGKLRDCGMTAYVWNANAQTFDADVALTREATQHYCAARKAAPQG